MSTFNSCCNSKVLSGSLLHSLTIPTLKGLSRMDKGFLFRAMAGWLTLLICLCVVNNQVNGDMLVNITFLESAVAKGAVCLDGSPPAYSYLEGFGNGSNNWIVYMQGGGWCTSKFDCFNRSKTLYGSSYLMNQTFFSGLLDPNCTFNPEFYNWHKFYIRYCDGSSFMSDIKKIDHETNLTFRGARIFNVMMKELLAKGMGNAQNAIFTGTSAGGLTTILYCDKFRKLLPKTSRVKCISDSGVFIRGKDQPGVEIREQVFANVVATHKLAKSLPKSCTSRMNSSLCLFPEYLVGDIKTPLFIFQSSFDSFQIENNLVPAVGGMGEWRNCLTNLSLCNSTQLGIMQDFRTTSIETLMKLKHRSSRGMFVHSCYLHGHILKREEWMCSSVIGNDVLANKTIKEAISNWYFDRSSFHEIDTHNELPRNCSNPFLNWEIFYQLCLDVVRPYNGSNKLRMCNS